ncbi:DNA-directed RNA polymerase [Verticillium alfalfae VaMs.102]|uniref:DNA-directed RNA polymerase n=1 Tax=Verticillium alfalfae (strain VaMs.102 / ATCC MYA-4576 / FGSC 10136) TaxID=526221 RepID=C9S6U0_VERA1|nr:DNA-directed RNA polymerase [Verticillium alfalfae VaMs.102]EEY15193.1 DNA-directed RNA polymerase [Verticillium alfalfae VaMs.102]
MLMRSGRRHLSLHHAATLRPSQPLTKCIGASTNLACSSRRSLVTKSELRIFKRRRSFGAAAGFSQGRTLATAMDDVPLTEPSSFGGMKAAAMPTYPSMINRPRYHDLRAFDPSSPLRVQEATAPIPRARTSLTGVPGDVDEMIAIFDACLRVDNLERAGLVLKRLSAVEGVPSQELMILGNQFLRASLEQLRSHPDRKQAGDLHKWYELFVRGKGLPQTAETVACMLKASLLSEHQPDRLDRLVLRYMSMAPGEAGLRVLSMADILNDQDLATITEVCPTYNLAPEEPSAAVEEAEEQATQPTRLPPQLLGELPEVLATPQKGFGLKTLKQTLTLFDKMPQDCDISTLSYEQQREIQARLERDCIDAAVERWREENESLKKMGLNSSVSAASLNSRLYDWQLALEARLTDEMRKVELAEAKPRKTPEDYDRCTYGPFLRLSTPSRLAAVTILGTLSSTAILGVDKGMPLSAALSSLAKLAEEDIRAQMTVKNSKTKTNKSKRRRVVQVASKSSKLDAVRAELGAEGEVKPLAKDTEPRADTPWPVAVKAKVAAALLSALIDTAKIKVVKEHPETKTLISQYQPAFSHATQLRRGKKIGMVLLNKELVNIMKREPQGDFLAKHLPMVVKPEPWSKFDKGGFLESTSNLVRLEIARAFRNQTFYFPHNIDFRGRAYPLPTYLNHMGADHVRGLLRFADGKELGEKGLKWLKVHLANVYGFDKASLRERESFAMDNLVNIFDSASKPMEGNRWWLKAEDPWQCLAACFELKAALESPEPTKFVSHLPVHQDGTCNGLQHYAALGGDTWGAKQVNLEPGDKPADVYSAVANIVKDYIAKDLETNNPFAIAVNGKITRKVVKQTVMTNVYGVTFQGAKKQVLKQLDAIYPDLPKESGISSMMLASYIATLIFKGLSSMFRGAHDIQYWLGEIGGRVCRALSAEQLERIASDGIIVSPSPVNRFKITEKKESSTDDLLAQFRATIVWTTPLRMPVAQPYRKSGTRIIKTSLQDLSLTVPERSDPVNRKKQLQAFPPNFIHSLDATHMLLSALECSELGLSFAAVHDSFWTHAADIDSMNRVLRDSFIRIHEEDVIGRLAAEFEARYKGSIYLAKVNHGTAVEKAVAAWRKQNRMNTKEELLLEYKRQQLLRSDDAALVEEGRQMETPASIFDSMASSEALAQPEDMEELGLGEIPEGANSIEAIQAEALAAARAEYAGEGGEEGEDVEEASAATPDEGATEDWGKVVSAMDKSHFNSVVFASEESKKRKPVQRTIQIWLPLSFPAIPKKGDFDVRRLRESEYFFS